jgi:hypothetical protein
MADPSADPLPDPGTGSDTASPSTGVSSIRSGSAQPPPKRRLSPTRIIIVVVVVVILLGAGYEGYEHFLKPKGDSKVTIQVIDWTINGSKNLTIHSVTTFPLQVAPGGQISDFFNVKNTASNSHTVMSFILNAGSPSGFTLTSWSPPGSTQVPGGQTKEFQINIAVSSSVAGGTTEVLAVTMIA